MHRVSDPVLGYLACVARWIRALPASWHVEFHALWDRVFGAGYMDVVWLGADLRPMVSAALEAYHGAGVGRTIVVASGRGTVPACCAMRRRCGDAVFAVQVQHPRCDPSLFDLVISPQHDCASLSATGASRSKPFAEINCGGDEATRDEAIGRVRDGDGEVCVTRAALHRLDATALGRAKEQWRHEFSNRPGPRLVVCIGGPTRHCRLGGWSAKGESEEDLGKSRAWRRCKRVGDRAWRLLTDPMGRAAAALAEEAFAEEVADFVTAACDVNAPAGVSVRYGSAFVTFSRRTPVSLRAAIHRHLALRMVAAHSAANQDPSGGEGRDPVGLGPVSLGPRPLRVRPPPRVTESESLLTWHGLLRTQVAATTDDADDLAQVSALLFGPKLDIPPPDRSSSPIALPRSPVLWVWDEQGPNPYEGAMAWADAVLVTADSVSMLSEAASLGVPVMVAGWRFARGKAAILLSALATAGVVYAMEDAPLDRARKGKSSDGVDDVAVAAARVRAMVRVDTPESSPKSR